MKISLTLSFCLALCAVLTGQPTARRSLEIPKLQIAPQIDGRLLDTAWMRAARTGDFTTSTPVFNQTPAGATEVFIFYTDEALYLAAVCTSARVRTDGSARDDLNSADWFRVGLDTWNDDQNAFQFAVNAAGIQADGRTASFRYDPEYDTYWQSAVSVTADGWTLEMRIPYTALRFPPHSGEQSWGLQCTRFDRSSGELSTWSPQDPNVGDGVWQYGELTGVRDIRQGIRHAGQLYSTSDHGWGNNYRTYARLQYGADVRLGLQSNTTLDLTVLPTTSSSWGGEPNFFGDYSSPNTRLGGEAPYPRQFNAEEAGIWYKTGLPEETPSVLSASLASRLPSGASLLFPRGGEPLQSLRLTTRTRQNTGISVYNAVLGPIRADYAYNGRPFYDVILQKLSNYNVVVAEQALTNNAWVSCSNANIQAGQGVQMNRTTLNAQLRNRANTLQFKAEQSLSRQGYGDGASPINSWRFAYGVERINRRLGWFAQHAGTSKGYSFSFLDYQRPTDGGVAAITQAGLSWTDFRPRGAMQNYAVRISSIYNWYGDYTSGRWNGVTINASALNRRFQTWSLFANLLQDGNSVVYSFNGRIIERRLSSKSAGSLQYRSDARKRFVWYAALSGNLSADHANDGFSLDFQPRWVARRNLILGAFANFRQSENNLKTQGFQQGLWVFERFREQNWEAGTTLDYYLTRRWWISARVGWAREDNLQREIVRLKEDRSLEPFPDFPLPEIRPRVRLTSGLQIQWQLRQMDYMRFSYHYATNNYYSPPLFGGEVQSTQLQLQMIFFLD
jgi:hypothetical protein